MLEPRQFSHIVIVNSLICFSNRFMGFGQKYEKLYYVEVASWIYANILPQEIKEKNYRSLYLNKQIDKANILYIKIYIYI